MRNIRQTMYNTGPIVGLEMKQGLRSRSQELKIHITKDYKYILKLLYQSMCKSLYHSIVMPCQLRANDASCSFHSSFFYLITILLYSFTYNIRYYHYARKKIHFQKLTIKITSIVPITYVSVFKYGCCSKFGSLGGGISSPNQFRFFIFIPVGNICLSNAVTS